jgi:DNA polymerase-3 subunit beta
MPNNELPQEQVKRVDAPPAQPFEVTADRIALRTEWALADCCADKKGSIPITTTVLVRANKKSVTLSATDLDIAITTPLPAECSNPGLAAVPAKSFLSALDSLDAESVTLKFGESALELKTHETRFELPTYKAENFPVLPTPPDSWQTLPSASFLTGIALSRYGISPEQSRYTLNAMLMRLSPKKLTMVATDGHRMPIYEHPVDGLPEQQFLLPARLVDLIPAAAREAPTVAFARTDSHLFFRAGKRTLSIRQIAGQFPNYERVVPNGNDLPVRVECSRADFIRSLRRVALFVDQRNHGVNLEIKEKSILLTTHSDSGTSADRFKISSAGVGAEPLFVGFNLFYLLDFLNAADTDRILLLLKNARDAAILKVAPSEEEKLDYHYTYVIMPMAPM